MPSLQRYEGYMLTDHRAGPGIPQLGLPDEKIVEFATLHCKHCGGCWIPNPDRSRQRNYCRSCDAYICDPCGRTAAKPNYMHRSFLQIVDLVRSGRWMIVGPISEQNLVPVHSFSSEVIIHG